MTEYYVFYDNINLVGKRNFVPVAFDSEKQADSFIDAYQYHGGIKQFSYDHFGKNKQSFIRWIDGFPELAYNLSREPSIITYRGWLGKGIPEESAQQQLYRYLLSVFGVRM